MLNKENVGLIVVDVQGKLAHMMHEKDQLFKNLQILIQGAKVLELPIIWIEQYPQGLGPTVPEIASLLSDDLEPVTKKTFSACLTDSFMDKLKDVNRKQLLICGIETHICVYQTARSLLNEGYEVHVVADAVSSRTPENREIGIQKMLSKGAELTSVEMALYELLQVAEGDQFKGILELVK